MSMNRSSASSFDPLSYYKKLTQCLAQKTNTKVNMMSIPGLKPKEKRISRPLITKQHLQAKFMAKYNRDKNQETSQGAKSSSEKNVTQKNIPIAFKVKTTQDARSKRRKPQENYINLPSSFFKSFEGPDMSIFKVPEVPPIPKSSSNVQQREQMRGFKKPSQTGNNNKLQHGVASKKQHDPDAYNNLSPSFFQTFKRPVQPPPSIAMTDITLGSVCSEKFQPGRASTPMEKHAPMISDPDEILKSLSYSKRKSPSAKLCEKSFRWKANKVMNLADKASRNIDAKGFADHPDPIDEILKRVMDIYEISCQSPRLINETLMSSSETENRVPSEASNSPQPTKYSLPIPEFFEESKEKVEHRKPQSQQHLERTSDIFKLSAKILPAENTFETPSVDFDGIFSSQFTFNSSPDRFSCASQELSPFSQQSPMMSQSFNFDSPMVVECDPFTLISPLMDISMDWESPDDVNNNTFAIFHSPPDTRPRNVRPSQRSKHSQREPSIDEIFNNHPDSSLSTYKWTPHINKLPQGMSQSSSSSALFEPYRPRNIFHNSFDLF